MGANIVKLEDVCEFYRGLTYSKKDEASFSNNIVLRANNIDLNTSTLDFDDLKYLRENFVIPEDKKLQKDCIFICMSSGSKSHLGKVAFIDRNYDYAFGGFMGMIKPKANILPRYLFYLLQTPEYKELLRKLSNGININNIKFSDLKDFEFDLPTLVEQDKIVAILDKADEIRTKKKQANEKLDEFLKSTFVDMFGDPVKNDKSLPIAKVGELTTLVSSGSTPLGGSSVYQDEGVLFIRSQNVLMNKFDFTDIAHISDEIYNSMARTQVQMNDVLLNITGASIGRIHRYMFKDKANVNQHVSIIRPVLDRISPVYLEYCIGNSNYQHNILRQNSGATRQAFNFEQIKGFKIPLPPIEEQNKFARIVEKVEEQKQKNEKVIEQMDNLFNSLSQRAFKGELQ